MKPDRIFGTRSDDSSGFSETFVPGESLGGVLLGETYRSVMAAHGKPSNVSPNADRMYITYGPTIQIIFSDTDGSGQLSPADTVDTVIGSYNHGEGIFRFSGVGTGSTAAEIEAVFGRNHIGTETFFLYKSVMFTFRDSIVTSIFVSKSE